VTPPALLFRRADEAAAALAAAATLPGPPLLLLLSAPAAAAWPGAAVIAAMVAGAASRHPGVPHRAALDCGTAAGLALDALRQGWRLLVLEGTHPAFPQVAGAASSLGATVLPEAPLALDLAGLDLRRPAARAIITGHILRHTAASGSTP